MVVRRSKYKNVRTTVGDRTFHSKAEAAYYIKLRVLEDAGEIENLICQPRFPLCIGEEKICDYIGDFRWTDDLGNDIVCDVKGKITEVYRLKKKLFLALYPHLDFFEISAKDAVK